ncbi:unnamed protein product [Linum trigynum]|uniref:Uncharacterized protein n=1 Tax=Linum trigynum TaxID=586398 RepID=A0AAV2EYD5_9ROSI
MSDDSSSSPEGKKPRRRWWEFGIVGTSGKELRAVLVGTPDRSGKIRTTTVNVTAGSSSFYEGEKFPCSMGYAVVGTKLYAFGGEAGRRPSTGGVREYPRDLYVCDLTMNPENFKSLVFEVHPNKLKGPKQLCINVAYKEKIIMLERTYCRGNGEAQCPAPCEVLNLKDLSVVTVETPFWTWKDEDGEPFRPAFSGHVVSGNVLYVLVWNYCGENVLYGLDMDKLLWHPYFHDSPLKWAMYRESIYRNWLCSRVVHGGKYFVVKPDLKPRLVVKNLMGMQQELDTVSELVGTAQNDKFFENAVVVPFGYDEDDDANSGVYCMFVWYRSHVDPEADFFKACKFKLIDNGDCSSATGGSSPPYDCVILSEAEVLDDFPDDFYGYGYTAFTPTSYIAMITWGDSYYRW